MTCTPKTHAPALLATTLALLGTAASAPDSAATDSAAPRLPDPLAAGWQGERVCELLHEDARQRILRCTFPQGVGHERHYHAPHFGYALTDATMEITDAEGTRETEISAGVSWVSEGVDWHEVLNTGDTVGVYLIVEPLP